MLSPSPLKFKYNPSPEPNNRECNNLRKGRKYYFSTRNSIEEKNVGRINPALISPNKEHSPLNIVV